MVFCAQYGGFSHESFLTQPGRDQGRWGNGGQEKRRTPPWRALMLYEEVGRKPMPYGEHGVQD